MVIVKNKLLQNIFELTYSSKWVKSKNPYNGKIPDSTKLSQLYSVYKGFLHLTIILRIVENCLTNCLGVVYTLYTIFIRYQENHRYLYYPLSLLISIANNYCTVGHIDVVNYLFPVEFLSCSSSFSFVVKPNSIKLHKDDLN